MPEPTTWDEDTHSWTHGAAITDVPTGTPDSGANATAINSILAALRSAGIIAGD